MNPKRILIQRDSAVVMSPLTLKSHAASCRIVNPPKRPRADRPAADSLSPLIRVSSIGLVRLLQGWPGVKSSRVTLAGADNPCRLATGFKQPQRGQVAARRAVAASEAPVLSLAVPSASPGTGHPYRRLYSPFTSQSWAQIPAGGGAVTYCRVPTASATAHQGNVLAGPMTTTESGSAHQTLPEPHRCSVFNAIAAIGHLDSLG